MNQITRNLLSLSCTLTSVFASAACPADWQTSSEAARSFALNAGIISTDQELEIPAFGVKTRWATIQALPFRGHCLLSLGVNMQTAEAPSELSTDNFEVVVLKQNAQGHVSFELFENVFTMPASVKVAVGGVASPLHGVPPVPVTPPFYYVELTDAVSVREALKSVYAKLPASGFSGHVVKLPKLDFDPTPNRNWRIVAPQFDMSRGQTAEIGDIPPLDFDVNFDATFAGTNHQQFVVDGQTVTGAWVAPWSGAFIARIHNGQTWIDLADASGSLVDPDKLGL